jgi:hypothetical protein
MDMGVDQTARIIMNMRIIKSNDRLGTRQKLSGGIMYVIHRTHHSSAQSLAEFLQPRLATDSECNQKWVSSQKGAHVSWHCESGP